MKKSLNYINNYISTLTFYKHFSLTKQETSKLSQIIISSKILTTKLKEMRKDCNKCSNSKKEQDIGLILGAIIFDVEHVIKSYKEKENYKKQGILGKKHIKLKEKEKKQKEAQEKAEQEEKDKSYEDSKKSGGNNDNGMSSNAAMSGATSNMMGF